MLLLNVRFGTGASRRMAMVACTLHASRALRRDSAIAERQHGTSGRWHFGTAWARVGSKRPKNQRLEWVAVVCFQAFASIFNIWPTSD